MNIFQSLKKEHGNIAVWKENNVHCFSIGEDLSYEDNDAFEEKHKNDDNITVYTARGDDLMNTICIKDIEVISVDVKTFLKKNVGTNCYSDIEEM